MEQYQEGFDSISEDSNSPEQKNIFNNLSKHFQNLFERRHEGNVVFLVGKKEIRAHEDIITARCAPLKAMLDSDCDEDIRKRIIVQIADELTFEEYLRYLYCGRVHLTVEICSNLLPIAHHYMSHDLTKKCEKYLMNRVDQQNVLDLFVKADLHGAPALAEKCSRFILDNGADLVQSKEWTELDAPAECLKNLLSAFLSPRKRRKLEA